jgi:hypothetical protein
MGKIKRKWRLDDRYAIWRDERWYSDMARAGWHLTEFQNNKVVFEQGPPKNTRYKVAYIPDHLDRDTHQLYHQAGWRPVAWMKDLQVFSAAEDTAIGSVERDREALSLALKRKNKGLMLMLIAACLGWIVLMAFHFGNIWRMGGFFLHGMGRDSLLFGLIVGASFGYVIWTLFRGYGSFRLMSKNLLEETPYPDRPVWRRVRTLRAIPLIIFLFLLGMPILTGLFFVNRNELLPLSKVDPGLPLVRLVEIEQSPDYVPSAGTTIDDVDYANHLSGRSSLLVPVQYQLAEKGDGASEKERGEGVPYKPSLYMDYYELRIPYFADGLVEDLIRHDAPWVGGVAIARKAEGLDLAYVAEEGPVKQLFVARGDRVAAVRYQGKQSVDVILSLLAEKLGK